MNNRQASTLIGISMRMEESLKNIEKSLEQKGGGFKSEGVRSDDALGSIANSVNLLVNATKQKFDKKNAANIINFSKELIDIVKDIDYFKTEAFSDFIGGFGKGFMNILDLISLKNIVKLVIASKLLFSGKKPVLKTVITGLIDTFSSFDKRTIESAKEGGEAVKEFSKGLSMLSTSLMKMMTVGVFAPLILIGALVTKGIVKIFISMGKHAKEIRQGGRAMKELGKGLVAFSAGIAIMALALIAVGPVKVLGAIAIIALFSVTFNLIGKASESITKGSKALGRMGVAMIAFSSGLAMLMLALIISTPKNIIVGIGLLLSFTMLFWTIGKHSKEIAEGSLTMIVGMSVGLFFFSGAIILLGTAVSMFSLETLMGGLALITATGLILAGIGKASKDVTAGAASLAAIGSSLSFFAGGILAFGVALKALMFIFSNDYASAIAGTTGIILGIGTIFGILGTQGGFIDEGAKVMKKIGSSLISLGMGVLLFGVGLKILMNIFSDDYKTAILATGGIIMGLGIAFALIGAMSVPIKSGSAAVLAMGGSLIIFSVGVLIFGAAVKLLMSMFENDLTQAGLVASVIILGMGVVFAGIGLLSVPIIFGAVSLGLMGVTLIPFSLGLMLFGYAINKLKEIDDIEKLPDLFEGIIWGVGTAFGKLGLLITIPIGAFFMTFMGASLLIFSSSLLVFGKALGLLNDKGLLERKDGMWDIKGMESVVNMAGHFETIGKKSLSPYPWLGVAFAGLMGSSLRSVGKGLLDAADVFTKIPDMSKFTESFFGDEGLILSLANAFEKIGKKHGGLKGGLLTFLGMDPVSLGIEAVRGMGSILKELAGGIAAFANFKEFPIKIPSKDGKLIYGTADIFNDVIPNITTNLPILLEVLADQFADIGDKYGAGFWTKSPVQKGMDAVKGMGKILKELAGGIAAFANFKEFPIQVFDPKDPSKLIYGRVNLFEEVDNIKTILIGGGSIEGADRTEGILFSLAKVFADIGTRYDNGLWSDSFVKKGIDAVSGMGSILSELVGGIAAFANFENFPIQTVDGSGKLIYKKTDLKDAVTQIKEILIGDGDIESATDKSGLLFSLANMFGDIGRKYGNKFWSDGNVKKGIDAVKGIGTTVSDIAKGIFSFAELKRGLPSFNEDGKIIGYTTVSIDDVRENIEEILNVIPNLFANIDIGMIKETKKKTVVIDSLMGSISKIAQSVSSMFIEKKKDTINLFDDLGTSISKFVEDIGNTIISDDQIKMLNRLVNPLDKFSKLGDGLSKFADSLTKSGTAFGTFARGFSTFSTSLDKFERFETSMSSLIKNAYKHKFNEFTVSMGNLKTSVNDFDVEKLKLTDSMIRSMAIISKAPDALGDRITDTLSISFKELIEVIREIAGINLDVTRETLSISQVSPTTSGVQQSELVSSEEDARNETIELLTPILTELSMTMNTLNTKLITSSQGGLLVSLYK